MTQTAQLTSINWIEGTYSREGTIGPYRIFDQGSIIAVSKTTSRGAQRFIGQFSTLAEALDAIP